MRIYFQLTTIDPVIVSQNNATTNNHKCLNHIPGSAILGALAAQYYTELSEAQSWKVFHSGEVKFSPCYPVVNKQITLPTPASWHFTKGGEAIKNGQYDANCITNHASASFEHNGQVQYKQCRDGYLTNQGDTVTVEQGTCTKTAIDRSTGSAKEGQLFSYGFINENQTFAGYIDSTDEELLNLIKNSLNQTIRIGRSRNNEFGRVKIEIVDLKTPDINNTAQKELVIWCLSDCEIINAFGMPSLSPSGKDIDPDLAGATLITQRSFIRTKRVSHFNQKRQGLDSEQCLICKGSVLTFKLEKALTAKQLMKLTQKGIGTSQQFGLGWIALNPEWAATCTLTQDDLFLAYDLPKRTHKKPTQAKETPLTRWLSTQVKLENININKQRTVNQLAKAIFKLYQNARCYNHILNSNEAGPSKTQWGRIREVLANNNDNWQKELFYGEQAICKAKNDELGWGIVLQGKSKESNFADEITSLLAQDTKTVDLTTMRLLIEQLSRFDLSVHKDLLKAQKTAQREGVAQ